MKDRKDPPHFHHGLLALAMICFCCAFAGCDTRGRGAGAPDPGGPVVAATEPLPAGFQRGMNLEPIGGFGRSLDLARLPAAYDHLRQLGVDHVALVPSFFQRRLGDRELYWRRDRERVAADTREAIRLAHARGLRVLLKPHLWLEDRSDGAWRGRILPSEEAWPAWRSAYRDAVLEYAELAAEEGVAGLSVGSELTDLALARPDFWRQLVADVRVRFRGQITYAANWDREFAEIGWWDAVDAIGVDAFWPLLEPSGIVDGNAKDATARSAESREAQRSERLRTRLIEIREHLAAVSERWQRPVLLTEIGYRSARDGAVRPWEWHADDPGDADPELQRAVYASIADVLGPVAGAPGEAGGWLHGLYVWLWSTDPAWGGPANSDFTPRDKPAAAVLAAWFGARPPGTAS